MLFYAVYRNPSEDSRLSARELAFVVAGGAQREGQSGSGSGSSLAYLLRQRKVYGLALGWGAYNYTFFLLLTWLPSYMSMAACIWTPFIPSSTVACRGCSPPSQTS